MRAGYRAVRGASAVRVSEVAEVAVYDTGDPEVVVGEHVVVAALPSRPAALTLPGLLVLRVRDGLVVHCRDYMDGLGLVGARGGDAVSR
ncbi:hypothetical protein SCATT_p11790 (plasmid) [Streptantibioticus cattleyicolor NRRL 8057 = DSM 46488]|uniref:SnoaL-like domain-containing protein n=1 Tax=Streptantibioticus cattleyicolor (strain ATCC 35852 / DSM 46488 / JCM 4925 / NBRC 14057 / NRRL 8057) TaxID=1003195 RepID=F8JME9_STREN|nr:hypothetical protein SCATT_p11790 [Streptantibioticus cattleyicolor NRRL 8057 = DSM 46488]CCB71587.1 protein of unknown function [Streptantibioticus cattleyicolor NRRL 8057 = DSM 46488]